MTRGVRTPASVVRRTARGGVYHRNRLLITTLDALAILRVGRWRAVDLADELRVGPRTAYRVLSAIEAAGVEVQRQVEGSEAYYRITRAALMRAFRL